MCGPGRLSILDQELIVSYVSGLRERECYYKNHTVAAKAFGVEAGISNSLMDDID